MPLTAGTKLDTYGILGLIGAGGMREVHRARDAALKRAWIVPTRGRSPRLLLPDDKEKQGDPSWSPDGRSIVFATGLWQSKESSIRILDFATHTSISVACRTNWGQLRLLV